MTIPPPPPGTVPVSSLGSAGAAPPPPAGTIPVSQLKSPAPPAGTVPVSKLAPPPPPPGTVPVSQIAAAQAHRQQLAAIKAEPEPSVLGQGPNTPGGNTAWQQITQVPEQIGAAFAKTGAGLVDYLENSPVLHRNMAGLPQTYTPAPTPAANALRDESKDMLQRQRQPGTTAAKAIETGTNLTASIAPPLVAGALGGPGAAIATGTVQATGDTYERVYERTGDPALAQQAGAGGGAIAAATGGVLSKAPGGRNIITRGIERAVEGGFYGGANTAATEAIVSAATGDKPAWSQVPTSAGIAGTINVGLGVLAEVASRGKVHLHPDMRASMESRVKAARTPAEVQAVVDQAAALARMTEPAGTIPAQENANASEISPDGANRPQLQDTQAPATEDQGLPGRDRQHPDAGPNQGNEDAVRNDVPVQAPADAATPPEVIPPPPAGTVPVSQLRAPDAPAGATENLSQQAPPAVDPNDLLAAPPAAGESDAGRPSVPPTSSSPTPPPPPAKSGTHLGSEAPRQEGTPVSHTGPESTSVAQASGGNVPDPNNLLQGQPASSAKPSDGPTWQEVEATAKTGQPFTAKLWRAETAGRRDYVRGAFFTTHDLVGDYKSGKSGTAFKEGGRALARENVSLQNPLVIKDGGETLREWASSHPDPTIRRRAAVLLKAKGYPSFAFTDKVYADGARALGHDGIVNTRRAEVVVLGKQPSPEVARPATLAGDEAQAAQPQDVAEVVAPPADAAQPAKGAADAAVTRNPLRPRGAVPLPALVDAAKGGAQKLGDYMTVRPVPKLARAGAADAAVEHASVRIATPHVVDDLLSKVFPKQYAEPEVMAKTIDVLNKDNILAGHDEFTRLAQEAAKQPDGAQEAQHYQDAADAVARAHDLAKYDREVITALSDPETAANVERWKQNVNPYLDQLYNEVKRVDPNLPREGRGRHTGARINLLSEESAQQWGEIIKDHNAPLPEPATANYRNPETKRDRFDRAASFTGKYATDARTNLTAVIGPRLNEATKLRFYESLVKSGAAVEAEPGSIGPKEIQGQPAARMPIKVPQTDPATGQTSRVERSLYVRSDLAREARDVLNTDMRAPQNAVARALTQVQLMQVADAVSHMKNIHTVVTHAQGAGSAWKDAVRKVPFLGTADAIGRIVKVGREVANDTPAIRAEIAEMAKKGLIRPHYEPTGLQKLTHAQEAIHKMDTASRVIMNRFFDNLVERGLAKDTPGNRRNFVNQVGQYNRRLMGPIMRMARDVGMSPFIVAGRNFNAAGRRVLFGSPGVEATGASAAAQMRATNLIGTGLLFAVPMMLNAITTGNPLGRSGTPVGAWDLGGKDDDGDGKHKVFDLLQLTGVRRGMRSTGINAAVEGLAQGKDVNTIFGNALTEIGQAAMHPWIGPAPSFVEKTLTGRQLDMRGQMEAQTIPEGGGKQYVENFRAALESQNPLLYSLARPIFRRAGFDQEPDRPADGFAKTLLKSPESAAGVKDVKPGTNAAEDLAQRLSRLRFGGGSMTPEQAAKYEGRKDLLAGLKASPTTGEKAIEKAVAAGDISEQQAAQIHKRAGMSSFKWTVKYLSADDAAKVYAVATPAQKDEIREAVTGKITNQNVPPAERTRMLNETGIKVNRARLEFMDELHHLRRQKKQFDDARKARNFAAMRSAFKPGEQGRLHRLESMNDRMTQWEKAGAAGKLKPEEVDRRIEQTVQHTLKKAG